MTCFPRLHKNFSSKIKIQSYLFCVRTHEASLLTKHIDGIDELFEYGNDSVFLKVGFGYQLIILKDVCFRSSGK